MFIDFIMTGLLEGVDYAFRVLAENIEGVSEALTLDQHVRPIRSESMYTYFIPVVHFLVQ